MKVCGTCPPKLENRKEKKEKKMTKVFIGNLDHKTINNNILKGIFSKYGKIRSIIVKKGYGFIDYYKAESAKLALEKEDGRMIGLKKVELGYSNNQKIVKDRFIICKIGIIVYNNVPKTYVSDVINKLLYFGEISSDLVIPNAIGPNGYECIISLSERNSKNYTVCFGNLDMPIFNFIQYIRGLVIWRPNRISYNFVPTYANVKEYDPCSKQ